MNSSEKISQKFSAFYDDIETQMSRLQKTDSFFSQLSVQSDDAKMLHRIEKGEVSSKEVDELLKTAKEFGAELESLRQKVARRKMKSASMRSSVPPMWDEGKLNNYIESIIGEVFDSNEENVVQEPVKMPAKPQKNQSTSSSTIKPILKTQKMKKTQKNVSTSVKFQIHQSNDFTSKESQSRRKVNKKVQAQFESEPYNETFFPCSAYRSVNGDGSVDVNFTKRFDTEMVKRLLTAPTDMKHSPITRTSTIECDKIAKQNMSRLATASFENSKQITTRCLPVLSIKGSCSIQKIYQLEISPSRDSRLLSDDNHRNTKFAEFVYEPMTKLSSNHELPISMQPSPDENPKNLKNENEDRSNFMDIRDMNRMLTECGIQMRDGKVHVVVEKAGVRKSNKKARARKSLTPSTLRKSIDELKKSNKEDNEEEKINICSIDDTSSRDRFKKKTEIQNEVEMNEMDSSMSSSITDDGKLRQILKINQDGERLKRSSAKKLSTDSYQTSSENCENSFHPQTPVDVGRVVNENFQSIYKLIEETFQPAADISENEKEIDVDGMKQMKEIIKMSEENIKRAGMLLQKYQKNDEPSSNEVEAKSPEILLSVAASIREKVDEKSINTIAESEIQTNNDDVPESSGNELIEIATKKQTVDSCVQTAEDKTIQTDGNLNWKSRQYFGNVYEKFSNFNHIKFDQAPMPSVRHNPYCSPLNPCACFGCEKRRSFQVPSYQSILDSGKSSPQFSSPKNASTSPKLPVPYNPIYSDDDEVMKAANKFLRSVEKRKNRNTDSDITSSESSNNFTPQKLFSRRNSSSISTPSSSLLNNVMQIATNDKPVSRARNNLDSKLQEASNELKLIEPLSNEAQPSRSLPASPQFNSSDLQLNQELLERYLSEGEVLSQGEIQLGLSDDDVPDDEF